MAQTQAQMLQEARSRGIGVETLADDASKAEIQEVLDSIGPTPEEAAQDAIEGASPDEAEEQHATERIISEAEGFLGVPSWTAAGALHGYDKQTITLTEAKAAVEDWQKSTVHVGEDQEA